jgi:hypothetical protein
MKVHKWNICTHLHESNAFLYDVSVIVGTLLCGYCEANKILQSWMSNHDEGTTFLHDVNCNVHILLCEYCEATNYYIPKL